MRWKMGAQRIKNKYKNSIVVIDGIRFDSQKEAARWEKLRSLEKIGVINNLQRQVKYILIPSQRDQNGKVIARQCSYYADFVYLQDGKIVVEDTKGVKTPEYIIKRKLMLYVHGIKISEV
jgi:hypothetical protein